MNQRSIGLVAAALLLTTACGGSSSSPNANGNGNSPSITAATPDEFAAARATFKKNCERCHGEQGEGGRVKLEDGTRLKVPSLREGHALRHPDSEFVKQITKGGDGMPAFKDKLTPEEINALIRFIHHEFQAGATPPAEPAKPMKDMKMK